MSATALTTLITSLLPAAQDPATGRSEATVTEVDAGGGAVILLPSHGATATVAVTDDLLEQLRLLENLGTLASRARYALVEHQRQQAAATRERRRQDRVAALRAAGPDAFGLTPADDGLWAAPGDPSGVRVRPVPAPKAAWGEPPYAAALEVLQAGAVVGVVLVDADDRVSTKPAHARTLLSDELLGAARCRQLRQANPWPDYQDPGAQATVAAHVAALAAAVSAAVLAWVVDMDAAVADTERVRQERAEESKDWAKLSRSKARIPAAALQKWLSQASHVDHDSTGYARDGYRVVAEPVLGRTRPRHLDPDGRRPGVGAKEVLYVARLVHQDVRSRKPRALRFYDHEISALRQALPGCVVRVPEDRHAIFVAFDTEEYRQVLDAAAVEWVLCGGLTEGRTA